VFGALYTDRPRPRPAVAKYNCSMMYMKRGSTCAQAVPVTRCSHACTITNSKFVTLGKWLKQFTESSMSALRVLSSHDVCQSRIAPVAVALKNVARATTWAVAHCLSNACRCRLLYFDGLSVYRNVCIPPARAPYGKCQTYVVSPSREARYPGVCKHDPLSIDREYVRDGYLHPNR
jgi:hypothetical protein